jgi:hypothetical protein
MSLDYIHEACSNLGYYKPISIHSAKQIIWLSNQVEILKSRSMLSNSAGIPLCYDYNKENKFKNLNDENYSCMDVFTELKDSYGWGGDWTTDQTSSDQIFAGFGWNYHGIEDWGPRHLTSAIICEPKVNVEHNYSKYRIKVTKNAGAAIWCLEELKFYDENSNRISTPSSGASAQTTYSNGNHEAYRAFNELSNNDDSYYCSQHGVKDGWLRYDFNGPTKITKYELEQLNGFGPEYSPVDWTFEGSLDGVNWVVLDEQKDHNTWAGDEVKSFELLPTADRVYFFEIQKNHQCKTENRIGGDYELDTPKECRDKCIADHFETYFVLWKDDHNTMLCSCYEDCDEDTRISQTDATIYEILSDNVSDKFYEVELSNAEKQMDIDLLDAQKKSLESELTTTEANLGTCENNLTIKTNELATTTTSLNTCQADLTSKTNELATTTTSLNTCQNNLSNTENQLNAANLEKEKWQSRYDYVKNNFVNGLFDTAEDKYTAETEEAVGVDCQQNPLAGGNSWFESIAKFTIGSIFGASVYAYVSSTTGKLVEESQTLL